MTAMTWQKSAVIYQIWPNSFQDSNGDGIGDLQGIISRLDYLKALGIDVVWLSPIYSSPQADMGYDISDYKSINPLYGTMQDFDNLLKGLHDRDMKLVMDLVVNHTSSEHIWFKESRSSKTNPKRDWYFWRPAKANAEGQRVPPNNWKTVFGDESAWKWDEQTQEYYLRLYTDSQPDLNWDNVQVREAVYDLMHFWLKKGIDGYRLDVINLIKKKDGLPDAPITEPLKDAQPAFSETANQPGCHKYLQEMHERVLSEYDIITVGETPFVTDLDVLASYSNPANKELQMVFTFELHEVDGNPTLIYKDWKLPDFKRILNKYQQGILDRNGWTSCFLENHDQARSVPRWATQKPELRAIASKMFALIHVGCTGTMYIYQGQEIGMTNLPKEWPLEDYQDVATKIWYSDMLISRRKATGEENPDMEDVMDVIRLKSRDHARSPVQWSDQPNAGFTTGTPWTRVNDDYKKWNAQSQEGDPNSVLMFWRKAIQFRKRHRACTYGHFSLVDPEHESMFAFTKTSPDQMLLVIANFSEISNTFNLPSGISLKDRHPALSNVQSDKLTIEQNGVLVMEPFEAGIWLVNR